MEAVKEITKWADGSNINHSYLLDGTKMVAYIPFGKGKPFYFKNPITIDKRGRKFEVLKKNPFKEVKQDPDLIEVKGSKGNSYFIDPENKTCTCPGYTFRGSCKHITELVDV
ncbi:MAG: hypothetical protein RLZZ196_320 [Bacteroidota bacterium]|jgi:hypothetical protein